MDDLISRQAATKHLKHRLYETAMNNDDLSGVFVEIAEHRIETWIGEVPSAEPSVITMRVDIDEKQFEKAWKQVLANSPLTAISAKPDTEEWIGGELGHTSKCGHEGCSSDIWDGCKNFYCPNCGRKVIWR